MKTKGSIFGNLNKILVRADIDKNFMTDDLVLAIYENINFFLVSVKKLVI